MSKKNHKESDVKTPVENQTTVENQTINNFRTVENQTTAAWANINDQKANSKVNLPDEIQVLNAKEYVDENHK